jgi:hypothetical protein
MFSFSEKNVLDFGISIAWFRIASALAWLTDRLRCATSL